MSEKIAIIDTDSIIYSSFYGKKVVDETTGEPQKIDGKYVIIPKTDEEIKETLNGIFHHIFVEGNFTHYIAYVKGENTIVDRLKYYPDYKQQRTKEIPEKWGFTKQYAIEKWGVIPINDIEVDDAVRITNLNIPNSHIVAIDKDLLLLEGNHFNWRKNEWYTVSKEQEEENFSRSMIIGDTVDNIKGIKGAAEKFCDKHNIKNIKDAFKAYVEHYPLPTAIEEFYKNFKCLYILEYSDKFLKIPTPIRIIDYQNNINNDETKIERSRSFTRQL